MIFIIFIFPQNYNFNNKLLGFIDYSTLFFNIFYGIIIYLLSTLFSFNISIQITFFILMFLPVVLISIIGFNNEKITYIIKYMYKYYKSPKIYVYKKF